MKHRYYRQLPSLIHWLTSCCSLRHTVPNDSRTSSFHDIRLSSMRLMAQSGDDRWLPDRHKNSTHICAMIPRSVIPTGFEPQYGTFYINKVLPPPCNSGGQTGY